MTGVARRPTGYLHWDRIPNEREGTDSMGIGTSIFLIAAGAILKWGINGSVSGLNLSNIGVILMIVGILGLLISLLYVNLWRRDRAPVAGDAGYMREREYRP